MAILIPTPTLWNMTHTRVGPSAHAPMMGGGSSFDNRYKTALANIVRIGKVTLLIGSARRNLQPNDLIAVLRDCRKQIKETDLPKGEYGFVLEILAAMSRARSPQIKTEQLMRLRRIAYPKTETKPPT